MTKGKTVDEGSETDPLDDAAYVDAETFDDVTSVNFWKVCTRLG